MWTGPGLVNHFLLLVNRRKQSIVHMHNTHYSSYHDYPHPRAHTNTEQLYVRIHTKESIMYMSAEHESLQQFTNQISIHIPGLIKL